MPRNQTYPNTFGSPMPTRQRSDSYSQYKFGFNGKEKDNEINVNGGDFPMAIGIRARIYDSRLGRWLSLDPMMRKYSNQSPFDYCINNPISNIDPTGHSVKKVDNYNKTASIIKVTFRTGSTHDCIPSENDCSSTPTPASKNGLTRTSRSGLGGLEAYPIE